MRLTHRSLAALLVLATCSAHAFTYREARDGDLSNDHLAPTDLGVAAASNMVTMASRTGDRDYFTFEVPDGFVLSSIMHTSYRARDDVSFLALQAGTTMTEPPTGTDPGNLLGYVHFGVATMGTEIIDDLANSDSATPPAMGFTAPLPSGDYTFWVQQTGSNARYGFRFVLTPEAGGTASLLATASPAPEPGTWALMAAGLAALAGLRARRRA